MLQVSVSCISLDCHLISVGFDLSSAYDITVPARGKALVKTDIAISIPENTYARVGALILMFF